MLELQAEQSAANAALDYNQFLFDELDEAAFKENENRGSEEAGFQSSPKQ